ncbi:MAG: 1-(5-phosphoribosyl)-5-((5-phosphoribosylamino)methylideneamino)imidazole-4-carboxamide isomerase [Candidatus Margulisiibacteriota bacterium]|nr:MAG: 1-(5-phosphoribosyl)-5-[(5-phosphoribosylamino)methylideneamino]imidazole-4-carboxamide isomerase [Candidatus Margulisbacteria bacterium GWD2_39_127]OGI04242.1 MAG: 1-(5-phosphoribosyl)-5-[(5-phosphoribosylamino)methylideneamino]imidazole-4-carboxamide isomerase [Candidatus Margulisbacteria bacterium GWF2_38_17]OGI07715.1 MAG: 1-(5-phosphoribosyl)-5-[(5-phosphoribosylamino)methylideneamino]imidazole-4-carboxamide isomerase [Candidatus Margulisbacteria bacterium GWE2_39_32]PZM79667.1 MAG:
MNDFEIIPAIDLLDGKCVRLIQGDYEKKTVFDNNPVSVAQKWENQGATRIHIVDLDGAKAGHPANTEIIKKIANSINIPVQVGGGIRTREDITKTLDAGAQRVILGTSLIKDPKFAKKALEEFSKQIIIGLDTRDGKISISGWTDITTISALQVAQTMEKYGAQRIIYTDIAKDGMLSGPNYEALQDLAQRLSIKVIASGGVATIEHITALTKLNLDNLEGCIVGKALYTNQLSLPDALASVR